MPSQIPVHVNRSQDGGFCAEVVSLPDVRTEADTFSELIDMVSDAVLTHFEIPDKVRAYIPPYLPPLDRPPELGA
jgi:predicted RNase H-like HicB family nuclease